MKKIKTSICVWLALSAVFMTGCYNDEDLWNKISGLENRIEALETWQAAASSNIDALQKLMDENDYITDVTPVVLGSDTVGYTIRFKNQEPATIYHGEKGEKGNTPLIGIKQSEDGNWSSTLFVHNDVSYAYGYIGAALCEAASEWSVEPEYYAAA